MKKPYDPKLREAAEEFKAICKKYDCAGIVLFVSPTHAEFVNHFTPSWSVIKHVEGGLRFRSKKEDFPSKETQDPHTNASVHMLTSMLEWSKQLNRNVTHLLTELRKHMTIVWSVWGEPDSTPGDGL